MKKRQIELISVLIYFLLVSFFVISFKLSYLPSILLYFAVPSIYLTLSKKEIFKKAIICSLLVVPLVLVFNYMATASKSWFEVSTLKIFFLNILSLDSFVFGFLFIYFTIYSYEYFFNKEKYKKRISKNIRILIYVLSFVLLSFFLIYFSNKDLLSIRYFYIIHIIFIFIIPSLLVLINFPRLISSTIKTSIYFAILFLIFEFSALMNEQWFFPGEYILSLNLFGFIIPLEEFIWILLAPATAVLLYEFFMNAKK